MARGARLEQDARRSKGMKLFPYGTDSVWSIPNPPRTVKLLKCLGVLAVLFAGVWMIWRGTR